MHSVSIAKQPFVKLEKEGGTSRIIRLCVDSGATSGCISKARIDKARMKITDSKPNAKVKVASGAVLPVVAIGDLTLSELSGFILESDGTRTSAVTDGTWHNMLVVDGLTLTPS